jgi:hypothetical protein
VAFTDVTLTRSYRLAKAGAPLEGMRLRITPTAPMKNAGKTVVPKVTEVTVGSDGAMSVVLAANTDPGTTPPGTGYVIREIVAASGETYVRQYIVIVPHTAPGGTVDLGTLDEVTAPELDDYVSQAELDALAVIVGGKQTTSALLTQFAALLLADNDVVQRKSGALAGRTPAQLAADLGLPVLDGRVGDLEDDVADKMDRPTGPATVGGHVVVSAVDGSNNATGYGVAAPSMNPIAAAIIFGG